jgi:hypothetical protein
MVSKFNKKIHKSNMHYIGEILSTPSGNPICVSLIASNGSCSCCYLYKDRDLCYKINNKSIFGPCINELGDKIIWIFNEVRERAVGETFRVYRGSTILSTCIDENNPDSECNGCYFFKRTGCTANILSVGSGCLGKERSDGKNIIFKRSAESVHGPNTMKIDLRVLKRTLCDLCNYSYNNECLCTNDELCMYKIILKDQLK